MIYVFSKNILLILINRKGYPVKEPFDTAEPRRPG